MALSGYEADYYAHTANQKINHESLQGEHSADVCVIGAGFTGLSAALHLAEKGYKVIVLEAQQVGWGASGRNGGQVAPGLNKGHDQLVKHVGNTIADGLWKMSLESVQLVKDLIVKHEIACDMKKGVLHVAAKKSHMKDISDSAEYEQQVLGYEGVQYLDTQQVQDSLGTDKYFNGKLYTEALHVHPLNYVLGLADAAIKAGVEIFEHSRVTKYQGGAAAFARCDRGQVNAKYILLACNGYLENLAPKVAGKIMPINNFILATEPLSAELCKKINRDDVAVADSRFVVNYFRLSADNRLLWGGGENYTRSFPKDIRAFVRKYMLQFYPQLSDVKIDFGWGGTLAITMNRMPHFDRIEENVFVAQGYSGHGVALATLGGKLMAEAISGSAERFDMFKDVPTPTFPGGTLLRWPGLVAGMLYYHMRDSL